MSALLGPIHQWLFQKILLVSQREELVFTKVHDMCGETAEELREELWKTYGEPLPDADLSTLIDPGNIHGWLQRQINLAESREASFIRELYDTCGDTARDLTRDAWTEHGKQCGQQAAALNKYSLTTTSGIHQALNDFYLNGMPCDQADQVILSEANHLVWETATCLQASNWQQAAVDPRFMSELYRLWLQAFVPAASPDFQLQQTADLNNGDQRNRYEISRNS
ncbi:MAG TPA: hypothetical protein VN611_01915 [Patescibacteria group bacterium]|nr:hypothetical protein [Patescibacteria group bacterium]